jgi:hypothetical protein
MSVPWHARAAIRARAHSHGEGLEQKAREGGQAYANEWSGLLLLQRAFWFAGSAHIRQVETRYCRLSGETGQVFKRATGLKLKCVRTPFLHPPLTSLQFEIAGLYFRNRVTIVYTG